LSHFDFFIPFFNFLNIRNKQYIKYKMTSYRKALINDFKKNLKSKPKIYFANKISKIRPIYGINVNDDEYYDMVKEDECMSCFRINDVFYEDKNFFISTGAVTIGCDHSCFHNGKHATDDRIIDLDGKEIGSGCSGGSYDQLDIKSITLNRCLKQIKASDIVIATINKEQDCFGTIAEVSYAFSLNKYIIVLFEEILDIEKNKELWFICKMSFEKKIPKNILDIIFNIDIVKDKFKSYEEYKKYMFKHILT